MPFILGKYRKPLHALPPKAVLFGRRDPMAAELKAVLLCLYSGHNAGFVGCLLIEMAGILTGKVF
jgi:hypothetical protein